LDKTVDKYLRCVRVILFVLFILPNAVAGEKTDVCIKYRKDFGWSDGYAVQGIVISGTDLNSAVGSLTRFKSFSTYVVVFWDEGQASIFELPAHSFGKVPMFESEVEDQYGRRWKIKKGHFMCR
jgi:hypothetical protein